MDALMVFMIPWDIAQRDRRYHLTGLLQRPWQMNGNSTLDAHKEREELATLGWHGRHRTMASEVFRTALLTFTVRERHGRV
jgi:hypothetical protein